MQANHAHSCSSSIMVRYHFTVTGPAPPLFSHHVSSLRRRTKNYKRFKPSVAKNAERIRDKEIKTEKLKAQPNIAIRQSLI